MADSDAPDGPPHFETAFSADDVEQRIYGTVLQTRDPTTAGALADRVGCDPKTARKYLDWFADLGIVTRHDGRPVTYERNDAYFEWRRVNRLAANRSLDELEGRVRELTAKLTEYETRYEAATPAAVDALAATTDGRSVDEVYGDLADWETARRERDHYERARQQRAGDAERERASG